jgi:flagellin
MLVAAPVNTGNATSAVAVPGGTSSINVLGVSYGANPSVTGIIGATITVGGKHLTVPNLSGPYAPATADMNGLQLALQNALQQADGGTSLTVVNNAGTLTISDSAGRSLTNFTLIPNQNTLPKLMGSNDLVINGFSVPGTTSVTDTVSNTQSGSSLTQCSGIAIAAAINSVSNQTGVTATPTPVTINGAKLDSTSTYGSTTPLYINGKAILIDMSSPDQNTRLNNEVSAINAQIGITGVGASIDANGGVSLTAADGRNVSVWFDNTTPPVTGTANLNASSFGLGKINSVDTTVPADGITAYPGAGANFTGAFTTYGDVTLASPKAISVTPGTNGYGPNSNFTALGFQQGTFGGLVNAADAKMNPPRVGRLSFQVGADANQTVSIDLPDFGSNGPITSLITWDASMASLPPGTQLNLPTGPQVLNGVSMGNSLPKTNPFGSFQVSIGGVQKNINLTPTDTNLVALATDIQNQINSNSGNTDLSVTVQGNNLRFASASGATIVNPVLLPIQNAPDGVYAGQLGQQDPNGNPIINGQPMTRSFIGSKQGANDVLAKLDNVMAAVDATRATMGAVMNRLDYVVDNLTNVSMNLTASDSAISDADYAAASTQLAKTSIMQQAATAVLAQANTSQQSVLKLLQG